jgi:hypothetical protein
MENDFLLHCNKGTSYPIFLLLIDTNACCLSISIFLFHSYFLRNSLNQWAELLGYLLRPSV